MTTRMFGRYGRAIQGLAVLALAVLWHPLPLAAEPLLIDGTTTLYQRILTRPDAQVLNAPEGAAIAQPTPFSPFYVFERNGGWLNIGPAAQSGPTGWIDEADSIVWRHALVLAFETPVGRLQSLFFEDADALRAVVEDERLPELAPGYVDAANAGTPPPELGILAIEPMEFVDISDNFYLLPILDAEETYLASGQRAKIVEVASIPLYEDSGEASDTEMLDDYKVGVVFVIDTTRSMGSYIDRTRQAVARIFERIAGSPIGDRVSFGLVAYRDSLEGRPELEYVARNVVPLTLPPDHDGFLRTMDAEVKATEVSSQGFNEDALAGIVTAIDGSNWKDFGGRYIILITDSGMRVPPDPLASTGMSPGDVNQIARNKSIAILGLLLATPMGSAYHAEAERELGELTYWAGVSGETFHVVPDGDITRFGPTVDALTDQIIAQVDNAIGATAADGETGEEGLGTAVGEIGHAMQLAYLGRRVERAAPDMFEAWAADFALNDPRRKAFSVRILLTKNQLSNLASALTLVLEAGTSAVTSDPAGFFDQLRTVVARAARDPSSIVGYDVSAASLTTGEVDNLGSLMGEFLDGLPYRSQLMEITEDRWLTMRAHEQDEIISTVRSKLEAYRYIDSSADSWIALYDGAPPEELVFPLPLDMLP
jgi:serine/threonine-protein kinase PpkA